jgi:hypothetical protein
MSLASLRRFERSGRISFESLLRIAHVLDSLTAVDALFAESDFHTLDEVLARKKRRQRGRRS